MRSLIELPPGVRRKSFVTVKHASEITGIPQRRLRSWIEDRRANGLKVYKIRGLLVFLAGELLDWLECHAVAR